MKKIIAKIIFQIIIAVILYFLLSSFPGMYKITAPIFCNGKLTEEIRAHSFHYVCIDNSGEKYDITDKIIISAFVIYFLIFTVGIYFLQLLIVKYYEKKNQSSSGNIYNYLDVNKNKQSPVIPLDFNKSEQQKKEIEDILPELEQGIVILLKRNDKLNAVKTYRIATGLGLKESLEKVEEIARKNGITL